MMGSPGQTRVASDFADLASHQIAFGVPVEISGPHFAGLLCFFVLGGYRNHCYWQSLQRSRQSKEFSERRPREISLFLERSRLG